MKGFVFTEFLEMVEDQFGFDIADKIIKPTDLPSKGVYTSIGTYDHAEIVALVSNLSTETGIPISKLLHHYGKYLFGVFEQNYKVFFKGVTSAFDFLEGIDSYIHTEVKKLYPQAELPKFDTTRKGNELKMHYQSSRKMSDFAIGLIEACMEYFGEHFTLEKEILDQEGASVLIKIQKLEVSELSPVSLEKTA